MTNFIKTAAAASALALMAASASAVTLTGSFAIEGSGQDRIGDPATGIDFSGATATVGDNDEIFGDFVGLISEGDSVDFDDTLTFAASNGFSYVVAPSGLMFTITDGSITPDILFGGDGLAFEVDGIFSLAGFDPTPGVFRYTGQQGRESFSFSTSQFTAAVPVPAAGFMLFAGLGGLAATRRKKAA